MLGKQNACQDSERNGVVHRVAHRRMHHVELFVVEHDEASCKITQGKKVPNPEHGFAHHWMHPFVQLMGQLGGLEGAAKDVEETESKEEKEVAKVETVPNPRDKVGKEKGSHLESTSRQGTVFEAQADVVLEVVVGLHVPELGRLVDGGGSLKLDHLHGTNRVEIFNLFLIFTYRIAQPGCHSNRLSENEGCEQLRNSDVQACDEVEDFVGIGRLKETCLIHFAWADHQAEKYEDSEHEEGLGESFAGREHVTACSHTGKCAFQVEKIVEVFVLGGRADNLGPAEEKVVAPLKKGGSLLEGCSIQSFSRSHQLILFIFQRFCIAHICCQVAESDVGCHHWRLY